LKNKAQAFLGGLVSLYILFEYGEQAFCILSQATGCGNADGWGNSILMVFISIILFPAILTIKDKKEKPIFWALTVFTSILIFSIPFGNKLKIPTIIIASALLLAFLFVELFKIFKKTLANQT
jgi:asparagine N-glycosylation enzyme membrane subunit Stt3